MKNAFNFIKKILRLPKKWLFLGAAILLILVFIFRPKPNPNQPQFASVTRGNIIVQVSASGTLEGKNGADLKFQSGGKLASVNVQVGDSVTKGEEIASLDSTQLYASLQEANNTLSSDQAAVDKILDDIHLSQYGNGGFSNVGTANETQTQREDRIAAQTARDSAVQAVTAAQNALSNAVLYSPIDGIVTAQSPVVGQNVSATDIIASIQDLSQMVIASDVDESDVGSVRLGQRADFTLNAYGDKDFAGVVSSIDSQTHTTSSGSTAVTVKVAFQNGTVKPIAGLNANVNITTAEKDNVLTIPLSTLRDDNTVLVKSGNGFTVVKVTPGLENDTDAEIISGLTEEEQVVTNPGEITLSQNPGFISKLLRRS